MPWKPYRRIRCCSASSRGIAYAEADRGSVAKKAVSKTATCGTSNWARAASMPATTGSTAPFAGTIDAITHAVTVNVAPGGKVTFDLTADAPGDWAFHCHNLYHMTAGMMRVVTVRPAEGGAT